MIIPTPSRLTMADGRPPGSGPPNPARAGFGAPIVSVSKIVYAGRPALPAAMKPAKNPLMSCPIIGCLYLWPEYRTSVSSVITLLFAHPMAPPPSRLLLSQSGRPLVLPARPAVRWVSRRLNLRTEECCFLQPFDRGLRSIAWKQVPASSLHRRTIREGVPI